MENTHKSVLLKKISHMNLITKIASLVIVMLTISIILVSFGVYSMKKTGNDLRGIAQTDIPLLGGITQITLIQLKQSIWFERSLMAAEIKEWDEFKKAQSELVILINKAFDQFSSVDSLIANLLKNKSDDKDTHAKYLKLQNELNTAQADYKDFSESITELLTLMLNRTITRHDVDLPLIKQQVENMSTSLQKLTIQINNSATATTQAATMRETTATDTIIITTIISLIIAITLEVWILRSIGKQLGDDPADHVKIAEALATVDLQLNPKQNTKVDPVTCKQHGKSIKHNH